jgi:hypothetical protein
MHTQTQHSPETAEAFALTFFIEMFAVSTIGGVVLVCVDCVTVAPELPDATLFAPMIVDAGAG